MSDTASSSIAPRTAMQFDARHDAVVQVYDSLRAVIFTAVPTPQNLTGCSPPDDAKRRLDLLETSLQAFPTKRVTPDPFVQPGPITLRFQPWGLPGKLISPLVESATGTSVHDAVVRLAWQVYESLRVVEMHTLRDPNTGEEFQGAIYDNSREVEVAVEANGQTERQTVFWSGGAPRSRHYSELPWSEEVWDQLYAACCAGLHVYYYSSLFSPHPGQLRTRLDHEAEVARAAGRSDLATVTALPAAHDMAEEAKRPKGKGKEIDARMLKALAENVERTSWSAREWADHLGCASSTIQETKTWKERLKAAKAMLAADAINSMEKTRTKPTGRRKPQHKSEA